MNSYFHASEKDNLITCTKAMSKGDIISVAGLEIEARDDIPIFHKMAIADIKEGEPVLKYGEVIGVAGRDIRAGEWAHIHNIESTRGLSDKAGRETP